MVEWVDTSFIEALEQEVMCGCRTLFTTYLLKTHFFTLVK